MALVQRFAIADQKGIRNYGAIKGVFAAPSTPPGSQGRL
jgi:hypothetical protein